MTKEEMKAEIQKTDNIDLIGKVRNYLCMQTATDFNQLAIACFDELVKRGMKAERRINDLTENLRKSCIIIRKRQNKLREELTINGVLP